jgi:hypothetical protein
MLMMAFSVAQELKLTLATLQDIMTPEEMVGWAAFLSIQATRRKKAMASR